LRYLSTAVTSNDNQPENAALLDLMSVNVDYVISDDATTGTLTWEFDAADEFNYLLAGESLKLTYTLTVTDSNGATDTQDVTVTITGEADFYDATTNVTFWKNGTILYGVTTAYVPEVTSSSESVIEVRSLSTEDASTYSMEVWKSNGVGTEDEGINNFMLSFDLPTGTSYDWETNASLAGWSIYEFTSSETVIIMGATTGEALADSATILGELRFDGELVGDALLLNVSKVAADGRVTSTGTISLDPAETESTSDLDDAETADGIAQGNYTLQSSAEAEGDLAIGDGTVDSVDLWTAMMIAGAESEEDLSSFTMAQLFAADVDRSGVVDGDDVALIAEMATGQDGADADESVPADEWIFLAADYADVTPEENSVDWSKVLTEFDLQSNTTVELVGIVKGDVDGSWSD